jgi:hypothetical protein
MTSFPILSKATHTIVGSGKYGRLSLKNLELVPTFAKCMVDYDATSHHLALGCCTLSARIFEHSKGIITRLC